MNFLQIITPTNIREQEERFFNSATYHPQFSYDWNMEDIDEWLKSHPRHAKLTQAILQQTDTITSEAQIVFNVDWNQSLLFDANTATKQRPEPLVPLSPEDRLHSFQQALDQLALQYTVILTDDVGYNVRPKTSRKVLEMSRHADLSFFSIEGEIRHELAHVVRHENTLLNAIDYSADFLPTEEGLATYVQDFGGSEPNHSLFQHAAEYAVTEICRTGSLRDAVEYLISIGFSPSLAWKRAMRHKFGFKDTSQPGDIMKPAMYFAFSQRIKMLSIHERLRLFVGKISEQDLPHYPEYIGRIPSSTLTSFFFGVSE